MTDFDDEALVITTSAEVTKHRVSESCPPRIVNVTGSAFNDIDGDLICTIHTACFDGDGVREDSVTFDDKMRIRVGLTHAVGQGRLSLEDRMRLAHWIAALRRKTIDRNDIRAYNMWDLISSVLTAR